MSYKINIEAYLKENSTKFITRKRKKIDLTIYFIILFLNLAWMLMEYNQISIISEAMTMYGLFGAPLISIMYIVNIFLTWDTKVMEDKTYLIIKKDFFYFFKKVMEFILIIIFLISVGARFF